MRFRRTTLLAGAAVALLAPAAAQADTLGGAQSNGLTGPANGAFSLAQPLQLAPAPATWTGPVSNGSVQLAFSQAIGATEALRTGTYSTTLAFTLSTTTP